jgi:precorrin-2 dehydrogenase / sirohydrochlorin ferrochelatase
MGFYPVFLDLTGRLCVVVGGGVVAERRVESLLAAGAGVTVVSPELTSRLAALAGAGHIRWLARVYEPGDLEGAELAFTAADDPAVSPVVACEARERAVWLNTADDPEHCDFFLPGLVRRGVLTVAVGSSGASPALTRALREHLDGALGPEWEALGDLAATARRELRAAGRVTDGDTWRRALGADVRALLAEGQVEDARSRLRAHLELSA